MQFSYGQFMVFDDAVRLPGCAWTRAHTAQGFARRESSVCFGTLLEFGIAEFECVLEGPALKLERFERVIAVPFLVTSGVVRAEGPEETTAQTPFSIPCGKYRLTAAPARRGSGVLRMVIRFERSVEISRSEIIVADRQLAPGGVLLEDADVA